MHMHMRHVSLCLHAHGAKDEHVGGTKNICSPDGHRLLRSFDVYFNLSYPDLGTYDRNAQTRISHCNALVNAQLALLKLHMDASSTSVDTMAMGRQHVG